MNPNGTYTFDYWYDSSTNLHDGMGVPGTTMPGVITDVECLGDCQDAGFPVCKSNQTAEYQKDPPFGPYYATMVCNCHHPDD